MNTHYDAFISYRHAELDSKIAAEVQYQLEHMKIPKGVKGTGGKEKISRIFRDKEELSITSDLNDDIADALVNTVFLIVICSPRLKESIWCLKEIESFLKNHDKKHVLTVLAEGETYDVIHEILTKDTVIDPITGEEREVMIEPLSCDYRMSFKKARREELLILAAGIIGCRYDDLVQRQKMYRQRRLMTAMAVVLAVITAFAIYAVNRTLLISRQAKQIQEDYEQSLKSQSIYLSNEANKALSEADTKTAIHLALQALPSEEFDRPWTPEAELALTRALNLYSDSTTFYHTAAKFYSYDRMTSFCISGDEKYIAVVDNADYVSVFEACTGAKLWDVYVSEGGTIRLAVTKDDVLIISSYSYYSEIGIRGYDMESGRLLWECPTEINGRKFRTDDIRSIWDSENFLAIYDEELYCISGKDGIILWCSQPDGNGTGFDLKFLGKTYYVGSKLCAVNMVSGYGEEQICQPWIVDVKTGEMTPIPHESKMLLQVYGTERGDILTITKDAYISPFDITSRETTTYINCLDGDTFEEKWSAPFAQYSNFQYALLAENDPTDYIITVDNTVLRVNKQSGEIAALNQMPSIPQYTYNRFMNLLLYLHFSLTGEKLDFGSAFHVTDTQYQAEIGRQHSEHYYHVREEHFSQSTYGFEQQMLALIREGEPVKLQAFLMTAASAAHIKEGKLAETPLRQAKNLFIGLVTMVGKFAAIPGGMDIEQCYQLIDTYIQECENLQTEEAVKNLQYNMPMDFANRVAQQKHPSGLSPETHAAMEYIATHINESIGSGDVVAQSGKSRAYLFAKLQQELGMGIGAYILDCRLREARTLLRYTDKSLGEISSYLCFSSQAHFQNVFKKQTGVTPMEYRRTGGST